MSKHQRNSHAGSQHQAAELQNKAVHAHDSAAQTRDKQDHETANEQNRRALEHHPKDHQHNEQAHHATATLAHDIWQSRGCPEGTAEEDWFNASQELRERHEDQRE